MAKLKTDYYFTGPAFWAAFDAQRAAYPGDDALLKVLSFGDKRLVQICGTDASGEAADGGDPINDSHPCPGSPGCP